MNPIIQRILTLCNRISAELRGISNAIRQHEQAEQERQKAQQEQQCPPEIAGIRDAIQSIAESQKAEQSTKQWHKDRNFLVSLAAVLVVGAYTFVTALQWHDANKNFRASQRPWIKIKLAKDGFPESLPRDWIGKPIVFHLAFSNVGQTPAREVNAGSVVEVVDDDKAPDFVAPETFNPKYPVVGRAFTSDAFGFVFPGAEPQFGEAYRSKILWTTPRGNHMAIEENLSEPEWQDLIAGKKYLAVWSVVSYRDIVGRIHWTAFCDWHNYGPIDGPFFVTSRGCVEYNNADDN